jgi:integrase
MGTVFRKSVTKPLPAGAELFTRKRQQFARWKDRRGRTRTAPITVPEKGNNIGQPRIVVESKYVAKYRDGIGVVREVATGCREEASARRVLGELERRAELVRANVMTQAEDRVADHQATPLADHFTAFDEHLKAKGKSSIYRSYTRRYLDRLAAECPFAKLADLHRDALERWLATRSEDGVGAKARNAYRGAVVTFANWCVAAGRLTSNPFSAVEKANEKADRRRLRRALTEQELAKLLDVARQRPLLDALTVHRGERKGERYAKVRPEVRDRLALLGWERALIYKTFLLTGLRKGELASLTAGQLFLDGPVPYAALNAADEKSREGNDIVLRPDLAADLRAWLAEKLTRLHLDAQRLGEPIPARLPGGTAVFNVSAGLLRIFNRDLRLAGIPKRDERGRTIDVHALRTTFGTLLSAAGVAPRTAQAAMRHSDIRLTMGVYTDPKLLDVAGALNSLPGLPLDSGATAQRATGTTDRFAPGFAPTSAHPGHPLSVSDQPSTGEHRNTVVRGVAASGTPVKRKGRLSSPDNRPSKSGREDLNLRPHGPECSSDPSQGDNKSKDAPSAPAVCTPVCTNEPENEHTGNVEALAKALLALPSEDRARLVALLGGEPK